MGGMVPVNREVVFVGNHLEKPQKGLHIPPIGLIISISVFHPGIARFGDVSR